MGGSCSRHKACPGCPVPDFLGCLGNELVDSDATNDHDDASPQFGQRQRQRRSLCLCDWDGRPNSSFEVRMGRQATASGSLSNSVSKQRFLAVQRIEELTGELFKLHDLNGDGLLDEGELIRLNEFIAVLHQGPDVNTESVRQKYRDVFREKLDPHGRPVPYRIFRRYAMEVLHELDDDPRAQEMILEQFIAEAESCRQVFGVQMGIVDKSQHRQPSQQQQQQQKVPPQKGTTSSFTPPHSAVAPSPHQGSRPQLTPTNNSIITSPAAVIGGTPNRTSPPQLQSNQGQIGSGNPRLGLGSATGSIASGGPSAAPASAPSLGSNDRKNYTRVQHQLKPTLALQHFQQQQQQQQQLSAGRFDWNLTPQSQNPAGWGYQPHSMWVTCAGYGPNQGPARNLIPQAQAVA